MNTLGTVLADLCQKVCVYLHTGTIYVSMTTGVGGA